MNIRYIEHSCFLIETEDCYLLFDYYAGDVSLPTLDSSKPLVLFSSHAHHDHFSAEIFALQVRYPKCFFVLSADIPVPAAVQPFTCSMLPHEHRLLQFTNGRAAVSVAPADTLNADALNADALNADALTADTLNAGAPNTDALDVDLSVETLRSNDEGVAFIVRIGDLCIYHAGDLNNWWWNGDTEDQKLAERYHEELEHIRGQHFTAAFIPLDPRLQGWWKGIEDFMHYADADRIFPMHNFGEQGLPKKLLSLDCVADYKDRICDVEEPLSCWKI